MMTNVSRLGCILLVLTMGLSGCFSAPLPADAAAPSLPPLSQTGLGANGTAGPGDSEPDGADITCTMVSARQEAGQEREYREAEEEDEPGVIRTPGPTPNASSDTLVVMNIGDEDWIRLQIQAPNHIGDDKRDEWLASRGEAFKVDLDDHEGYDGTIRFIEGETQISEEEIDNVTEEGLVMEFKIRAAQSGWVFIKSLRLPPSTANEDGSRETYDWRDCAHEGSSGLMYYINPES